MNIKNTFFLLADSVIQDEQSKKISLINIFDQLNTPKFPALVPPFFLVSQFVIVNSKSNKTNNSGLIEYKFTITEAGGDEISLGSGKIKREFDKKLGAIMKVNGYVFKKAGSHLFKFIIDSKTIAEFDLIVRSE